MSADQGRVQVDHDRPLTGEGQLMGPHPVPSSRPSGTDRRYRGLRIRSQRVDEPAHGRVGGHRTEQLRLRADHREVGQAIPAQRDRHDQIQQCLAGVVHRPFLPPRRQHSRQPLDQSAPASGLQQQRRPARRDQRLATRLDTNPATNRDSLHLRSAFPLGLFGPQQSKNPVQDRHFRALRAGANPRDVKDRG